MIDILLSHLKLQNIAVDVFNTIFRMAQSYVETLEIDAMCTDGMSINFGNYLLAYGLMVECI